MDSKFCINVFRFFMAMVLAFELPLFAGTVAVSDQELYVIMSNGTLQVLNLTDSFASSSRIPKNRCDVYNATLSDGALHISGQNEGSETCSFDDQLAPSLVHAPIPTATDTSQSPLSWPVIVGISAGVLVFLGGIGLGAYLCKKAVGKTYGDKVVQMSH